MEVVCHDDEVGAGLICPEAMHSELVNQEVVFDFLDSVLRVGSSPIQVIYDSHGQVHVGDETTVAVAGQISYVGKKRELFNLLSGCFRPLINLLANHHDTPLLFPIKAAVGALGNVYPFSKAYPFALIGELVLDAVVEAACNDIV